MAVPNGIRGVRFLQINISLSLAIAITVLFLSAQDCGAFADESHPVKKGTAVWDVDALKQLKQAFEGDVLPSWTGMDPCNDGWEGVTCEALDAPLDDGGGRVSWFYVSELDLSGMQLQGSISTSIGSMLNLKILNLADNQLNGEIPWTLRSLYNLTVVDLSNNNLTGKIPSNLAFLRNLTTLSLAFNNLVGIIPKEFQALQNIERLFLNSNNLVGRIPRGFAHTRKLIELNLDNNNLTSKLPFQISAVPTLQKLIVSRNNITGPIPVSLSRNKELQILQLDYNKLDGTIPSSLGTLTNLIVLELKNNQLTGSVPASLASLPRLEVLGLQNNQLEGEVHEEFKRFRGSFGGNSKICIDLGDNRCHPAPAEFLPWIEPSINISHMPCAVGQVEICRCADGRPGQMACIRTLGYGPCSCRNQFFERRGHDSMALGWILAMALVGAAVLTALIGGAIVAYRARHFSRKKGGGWEYAGKIRAFPDMNAFRSQAFDPDDAYNMLPRAHLDSSNGPTAAASSSGTAAAQNPALAQGGQSSSAVAFALKFGKAMNVAQSLNLRQFSLDELQMATSNFSPNNVISTDHSLRTFSGVLPNETFLAVKELPAMAPSESPAVFASVLETLSSVHGAHLVEVIGFCSDPAGGRRYLVYELVPNGTVHMYLHDTEGEEMVLEWVRRVDVALGVAQGLQHLHDMTPQIAHENLTSSSVLLDDDFMPKLADYCLSALTQTPQSAVLSNAAVAAGTVAPELAWMPKYTARTDVYAFGIFLLELITGRQALDPMRPPNEQSLVRWAKPKLADRSLLEGIVDAKLQGRYSKAGLLQMAVLAAACVHADPESRPSISFAVDTLLKLQMLQSS